jgi:hypothetical protein
VREAGPRPLVFVAHPFGGGEAFDSLASWSYWLTASEPQARLAFPPYGFAFVGTKFDGTKHYDDVRGLRAVASRCAGVVLVAGVVTLEMTYAIDAVLCNGGWLANMTSLGPLPPARPRPGCLDEFRHRAVTDPGAELEFESRPAKSGVVVDLIAWLRADCLRLQRSRN